MKPCPMCGESIQDEAIKCRYCGEFLQRCQMCGTWNSARAIRCGGCGAAVQARAAPPPAAPGAWPAPTPSQPAPYGRPAPPPSQPAPGAWPAPAQRPGVPATPQPYQTPQPQRPVYRSPAPAPSRRSFVGWAFLTWLLYYVGFYVIGLIANIVLLGNAGAEKRRTGGAPAGMGCLWILLIVHLILPIVLLVLFLTGGLAGLTSALESGTW